MVSLEQLFKCAAEIEVDDVLLERICLRVVEQDEQYVKDKQTIDLDYTYTM